MIKQQCCWIQSNVIKETSPHFSGFWIFHTPICLQLSWNWLLSSVTFMFHNVEGLIEPQQMQYVEMVIFLKSMENIFILNFIFTGCMKNPTNPCVSQCGGDVIYVYLSIQVKLKGGFECVKFFFFYLTKSIPADCYETRISIASARAWDFTWMTSHTAPPPRAPAYRVKRLRGLAERDARQGGWSTSSIWAFRSPTKIEAGTFLKTARTDKPFFPAEEVSLQFVSQRSKWFAVRNARSCRLLESWGSDTCYRLRYREATLLALNGLFRSMFSLTQMQNSSVNLGSHEILSLIRSYYFIS